MCFGLFLFERSCLFTHLYLERFTLAQPTIKTDVVLPDYDKETLITLYIAYAENGDSSAIHTESSTHTTC